MKKRKAERSVKNEFNAQVIRWVKRDLHSSGIYNLSLFASWVKINEVFYNSAVGSHSGHFTVLMQYVNCWFNMLLANEIWEWFRSPLDSEIQPSAQTLLPLCGQCWEPNRLGEEIHRSDQIRSVAQPCPTLCYPMNRSTPGLPVHHQLQEFT